MTVKVAGLFLNLFDMPVSFGLSSEVIHVVLLLKKNLFNHLKNMVNVQTFKDNIILKSQPCSKVPAPSVN